MSQANILRKQREHLKAMILKDGVAAIYHCHQSLGQINEAKWWATLEPEKSGEVAANCHPNGFLQACENKTVLPTL